MKIKRDTFQEVLDIVSIKRIYRVLLFFFRNRIFVHNNYLFGDYLFAFNFSSNFVQFSSRPRIFKMSDDMNHGRNELSELKRNTYVIRLRKSSVVINTDNRPLFRVILFLEGRHYF